MRKRPWIVAALSSACLLLLAARLPLASEIQAGSRVYGSPLPAKVQRAATNDPVSDAPPAFVLDSSNVRGILGSQVRSATDEDMGRIVDVIIDRAGIARAAVIDFGGFLGVGSRRIAIDWNAMRFTGLNRVWLDLTRDQVKAAPQYELGKPIVVLSASAEFVRSRVTERMPER